MTIPSMAAPSNSETFLFTSESVGEGHPGRWSPSPSSSFPRYFMCSLLWVSFFFWKMLCFFFRLFLWICLCFSTMGSFKLGILDSYNDELYYGNGSWTILLPFCELLPPKTGFNRHVTIPMDPSPLLFTSNIDLLFSCYR